jgi:3',5'-cyclic AMP phosphodiesterase CpdA
MFTRRNFIALGGIVLASATGAPRTAAACEAASDPDPAPPPRPVRVALLSDSHLVPAGSYFAPSINRQFAEALTDLQQIEPDLWLFNGDLTEHGYPEELAAFRALVGDRGLQRALVTTGNHEFFDADATDQVALERFQHAFGLDRPYSSRLAAGVHFVMLADEQYKTAPRNGDWAWLTPEQLAWFEQVLAVNRGCFTVVCLHQPLQETVSGSRGGNAFAGSGQAGALRQILKRNPQVRLWFSGHTHMELDAENQLVQQGRTLFLGLGSTCYLYTPASGSAEPDSPAGYRKNREASQSRVLEIWPDRVAIRTRDHAAGAWLDHLEISIRK